MLLSEPGSTGALLVDVLPPAFHEKEEKKEDKKPWSPPTLDPSTPSPIFGGSTGGLLRKAQARDVLPCAALLDVLIYAFRVLTCYLPLDFSACKAVAAQASSGLKRCLAP